MIEILLDFLSEDLGSGDITTDSVIGAGAIGHAFIISRETGVLAGVEEAELLMHHFSLEYGLKKKDGQRINQGDIIATISGDLKKILKLERLILNILSRMSGIATLTHKFSTIGKPYGVIVMGTRKTTPGFRYFEKKAIEIGGGMKHREGLYDEILIKDNHIAAVGIEKAVRIAKQKNPNKKIEIEVSTLDDAVKAIESGAEIIMLDNLSPRKGKEVINGLREIGLRENVTIELSGGINEKNIQDYVISGADRISIGSLTTDSRWLDFSMKIKV